MSYVSRQRDRATILHATRVHPIPLSRTCQSRLILHRSCSIARTHARTYVSMYVLTHACTYTRAHALMHAGPHTYTRTHTPAYEVGRTFARIRIAHVCTPNYRVAQKPVRLTFVYRSLCIIPLRNRWNAKCKMQHETLRFRINLLEKRKKKKKGKREKEKIRKERNALKRLVRLLFDSFESESELTFAPEECHMHQIHSV